MRSAAAPIALVALIGIPVLIGQQQAGEEEKPSPREAELTVQLTGDEGTSKPKLLRIAASGKPGKDGMTLASDDGLKTAKVKSVDEAQCKQEPRRDTAYFGPGASTWCLMVEDAAEHAEVAGTVTSTAVGNGKPTSLALTVKHRDAFWPAVGFTILGAFVLSFLGSLLTPALGESVVGGRLGLLVARNRDRIEGLDEWVRMRKAAGDSGPSLLDKLAPVVNDGPSKAAAARTALNDQIAQTKVREQHPYVRGAAAIADPARPHAIGDFLDADGKAVDHPAETWNEGLATLEQRASTLASSRLVADRLKNDCRTEIDPLLDESQAAFERIATPAQLDELDAPFSELKRELDEKRDVADCRKSGIGMPEAAGFSKRQVTAVVKGQLTNGSIKAKLFGLGLVTLMWIVGALALAFFTVKYANYEGKDTFGSDKDWFSLIAAALASGVTGAILGLLTPWGVAKAEE